LEGFIVFIINAKIEYMSQEPSFEKMPAPEPKKEKSEVQIEFEKHEKEMEEKEKEVRPEIEEKFRDALGVLHTEIQSTTESKKSFPSESELRKLIEGITVFAQMAEGAKRMFVDALQTAKEFKSPDPEVFINKGMEVLDFFIHTATLKKGGEAWLQEKLEERLGEIKPEETEENPETEEPSKEI